MKQKKPTQKLLLTFLAVSNNLGRCSACCMWEECVAKVHAPELCPFLAELRRLVKKSGKKK